MTEENNVMKDKLTTKQKIFCQEYLIDLNATQAAIRAGYSKRTANEQGSQNLAKLSIQNCITDLMTERIQRTNVDADKVLREVVNIANANMREYLEFGPDGVRFKDSSKLTQEQMARIAEIQSETKTFRGETSTNVKFKLYAKDTALYTLMRHLGLFKDKLEHTMNDYNITLKIK
jgi:phage terminase small subunit